jgi:large subunit ribosomal protein L15
MRLHDLRPAKGSHKPRTRVGRGIAAGQGKTAGRGTKGQKARAGGSIPPWFEGGQTPLHMRIPKLRGFKNRFKVEYEIVNVGAIGALAEGGAFETDAPAKGSKAKGPAQITINQDILRAVGLVRTLDKPLKVLGAGDVSVPLFVVADAFSASARTKIEAAGGTVNVLEVPTTKTTALKGEPATAEPAATAVSGEAPVEPEALADVAADADAAPAKPARKRAAKAAPDEADADAEAVATAEPVKAKATAEPVEAEATAEPVEAEAVAEPSESEAEPPADEAETTSGDDA